MTLGQPLPATASPVVAVFGKALLGRLHELTDTLVAAILVEDPSYAATDGVVGDDLRRSCHANLHRILQALTGETETGADPLDAPRATGRRRAEQGVPLESVLHAYRVGFRVVWEGLVAQARDAGSDGLEPLVAAATEVWELVDVFSSTVSESYRDTQNELARRGDRRRDALIDALLDGRGTERALAADAAAALDLPEHGRYAVVVVAGEAHRGVAEALRARGLRSAWRTRTDRDIGLIAVGRAETPTLVAALAGVEGLRAGVSPVVDGLAAVDGGYRLADTTLRTLPQGWTGVADLESRLPAALLVTAPDLAARLVTRALGGVLALEPAESKVLLDTLRTWLDTGGSAGQTATRLYCHRNTVLNRLRRLEGLTERSTEQVDHLVEWALALLALDVLPADRGRPPLPAR